MKSISATHNNKTHFTRNASSLHGAFFISKEVKNTMKKNLFKRGMAGLLSLVMCLTALVGIGTTTAYAAGERAEVYLVSFPRSGDANIDYSGTWGHPNLRYMNGWHSGESKYTTIRAMHSYDGILNGCKGRRNAEQSLPRNAGRKKSCLPHLPKRQSRKMSDMSTTSAAPSISAQTSMKSCPLMMSVYDCKTHAVFASSG